MVEKEKKEANEKLVERKLAFLTDGVNWHVSEGETTVTPLEARAICREFLAKFG